jgi:hypothetical protein
MKAPRRFLKAPRRFPISLATLLALGAGVLATDAQATAYVARQADSPHVSVVFSVSGSRIAADDVALSCRQPGSARPGRGSGEIADGRFAVRIGYEYLSGRRSARPAHLWAKLTGVLHGATITGTLSTSKPAPCSGGHFTAAVASAASTSASPGTEAYGQENEGERSTEPGAPFGENGNYEAAFNAEWEAKIEQLCHSRPVPADEGVGQSATAATCSTPVSPEAIPVLQAE